MLEFICLFISFFIYMDHSVKGQVGQWLAYRNIQKNRAECVDKNLSLLINCVATLVTFSGGSWGHGGDEGVRNRRSKKGINEEDFSERCKCFLENEESFVQRRFPLWDPYRISEGWPTQREGTSVSKPRSFKSWGSF